MKKNPFILFSPFLLLFVVIALYFHNNELGYDETGYLGLATNLTHGFYSPPAPNINLWWGPGWPLILTLFVAFKTPLVFACLLNAVFHYLSIVLVFKSILHFLNFKKSLIWTTFWAVCYSSYPFISQILSEAFSYFLVSCVVFFTIKSYKKSGSKYLFYAGISFGFLALTKVIFAYVLLSILIGILILWIFIQSNSIKKAALIFLIAFATNVPYLIYTYQLTGKYFYWANSGGNTLYWMSNPNENEYGNWDTETFVKNGTDSILTGSMAIMIKNHQSDIDSISKYVGVEKDDTYKRIAINNIKNNPLKYLKNIVSNISRAFFGFPDSYSLQRPMLKIWYFSILFTLLLVSLIIALFNWKKIEISIRFILVFSLMYLIASSLVSGNNRQLIVIVPALILCISYLIHHSISFHFGNFKSDT